MPTRSRIQGSVVELSEIIPELGYEVSDFIGPIGPEGEELAEDEIEDDGDTHYRYYLLGDAGESRFYISFNTESEYASIVYPMNILRHLASYLDETEVEAILDNSIKWDNLNEERKQDLYFEAVEKIIDNTEPAEYHRPAFTLSAYASTSLVSYRQTTISEGFPTEIQCDRGIFPYSEQLTLQYVDDHIQPVLIAGERGRRYVEYSFRIDKEDKEPPAYKFTSVF